MLRGRASASGDETRTTREDAARPLAGLVLLVAGPNGVRTVSLSPSTERVIIGRADDCDVAIDEESLSRRHARLTLGQALAIEDLGSKNGSSAQGRKLGKGEAAPVSVGSVFELGSVTFVLQRSHGDAEGATKKTQAVALETASEDRVVHDPTMKNLYRLLDVIAPSPLAVLILGETGVGKEVYARALHARSPRASGPFVSLHCAALPESLLEAELFGYEKGAFTGATQAKAGLFETADRGTVFLDEIGEVPVPMQAKLLRVLEGGEVMRLGARKPLRVDVRCVSATHRDVRALIAAERFRADLYFRLNGMTITLPPLRARRADIAPLARKIAARTARAMGRDEAELDDAAIARLEAHDWPGNVRELKNVVERAVVLADGRVLGAAAIALADPEAFGDSPTKPIAAASAPSGSPEAFVERQERLKIELREVERERVIDALSRTGGNQSRAAGVLGMSRYTLMERMEEFGLGRPRKGK